MRKFEFTPEGRAAFLKSIAGYCTLDVDELEATIKAMEVDVSTRPPPPSGAFIREVPCLNGFTMVLSVDWFVEVVEPSCPSEFILDYAGTPKPPVPSLPVCPVPAPTNDTPGGVPVWGPADQRALESLQARKLAHEIHTRRVHREALAQVLTEIGGVLPPESVVDKLIAGADKLIAALQPFSKEA